MKTDLKIALGAFAVGVAAFLWVRKHTKGTSGIGSTKKYYVYAGYYENYISSEPMPDPYILRRTFRSIDRAIDYADSFGDEVIYCENVKYDLPDYLYEALQDEDYEYFTVSGIGATKRRVFKELSLAQKAGVDFTKRYDELTPSEIKALQKVSNDTGYTETYYKSLKKAYDAISGIGEAYDVVNADGDTVLTWIEDPDNPQGETARKAIDDAERYLALREARDIENDREWASKDSERKREELEAQLAEQRKRLKKAGRSSQMALFGVNNQAIETELFEIWRELLEYGDTDYDFDTWRAIYGNEYAQAYVLPYM